MTLYEPFRFPRSLISLLLLLCFPLSVSAANIKCWTNKDKVRECGHTVPPEYSQQRIEIINDRGIVIEVKAAAKTKQELAEEARLAKIKKEQDKIKAEQKRRDDILLRTFTTERDLRLSRKNRVQAVQSIIEITNSNTRTLTQNLADLQKQAANYERSGQKIPQSVVNDIESLKQQIKDNETFISKKVVVLQKIDNTFEADLERFRVLKGIKPTADKKKTAKSAKPAE